MACRAPPYPVSCDHSWVAACRPPTGPSWLPTAIQDRHPCHPPAWPLLWASRVAAVGKVSLH